MTEKYFCTNVMEYVPNKDFCVYRPASLDHPKSNAVMFITGDNIDRAGVFESIKNCLIFWPQEVKASEEILNRHAVCICADPHLQYCCFFKDHNITHLPAQEEVELVNGAYISPSAQIGKNVTIMPGAYIGGECVIGDGTYIGCGAKLVGEIFIGNNVVIRENVVIGADGLSTDRDERGMPVTMPQFGQVILDDGVQIGANTVVARGAIDETYVGRRSKIDNNCFISHNVHIGEDVFIVGETIMFGSSSTGDRSMISGNSTVRNGVHIGEKARVGMGSVVTKNVIDGATVKGNPAR